MLLNAAKATKTSGSGFPVIAVIIPVVVVVVLAILLVCMFISRRKHEKLDHLFGKNLKRKPSTKCTDFEMSRAAGALRATMAPKAHSGAWAGFNHLQNSNSYSKTVSFPVSYQLQTQWIVVYADWNCTFCNLKPVYCNEFWLSVSIHGA